MTEVSVQAVLRGRRMARTGWLSSFGVALGVALWLDHPTGTTTAVVVGMAIATIAVVVAARQNPQPALSPLLATVGTLVVGGGLAVLDRGAAPIAVAVFVAGLPALGGLGVNGGGTLALCMVAATSLSTDAPSMIVLLTTAIGGWTVARGLQRRELTDISERVEQTEVAWALARRAQTDALTRLPNRLSLEAWLDEAVESSMRGGDGLSLLAVDIDHFKRVNDTHGHPTGDRALTAVARAIQGVLRHGDVAGRWGGEEFLVVLTACAPDALGTLAERVRCSVEELELAADDGTPIPLTVSVGGAVLAGSSDRPVADLVAAADRALYRAKEGGRNRVALDAPAA